MLNAMPACVAARCGFTCLAGFHLCGGVCVSNDATDSCGLSCSPCPTPSNALATCTAGGCGFTCLTGFADCDGVASNGCEVNLATTNAHCGRCGNACPASWTCVAGGCEGDLTLPATVQRWGANTVGDWDSIRNGLWDPPGGERYYFDTFADPAMELVEGKDGGWYPIAVELADGNIRQCADGPLRIDYEERRKQAAFAAKWAADLLTLGYEHGNVSQLWGENE
jgi:hypothetical protein